VSVCSVSTARAAEASARLQADQRTQQAASQPPKEMQQSRAALAALQNARVDDAEQARLSAVSIVEQHSLYAKQANDRANSFEQQAKHAQLAAQQDAQQKANRIAELERLVEQLIQQVMQLLAGIKRLALFVSCSLLAKTRAGLTCMTAVPVGACLLKRVQA